MPDPADPTPVAVKQVGGQWAVVDRNGRRVPGEPSKASQGAAQAVADRINATWSEAKSTRKAKGAPEITREAKVIARALAIGLALDEHSTEESVFEFASPRAPRLNLRFDPRLHRRDRLGKFAEMVGKLKQSGHGSTLELPSGVRIRRTVGGLEVSGPGGQRRPEVGMRPFREHLDHPHAAAAMALRQHDRHEIAKGADPDVIERQTMADLRSAYRTTVGGGGDSNDWGALEQEIRNVRMERSSRHATHELSPHHGRSRKSLVSYRKQHHVVTPEQGAENLDKAFAAAREIRARRQQRTRQFAKQLGLVTP